MDFGVSYEVPLHIFDLQFFDNKTTSFLKNFEICAEMYFVSLFLLNERNITTSFLMVHLKCTVVDYANLNSSSINKPFLSYRLSNILFCFLRLFISVYFNKAFVKNFIKKPSVFNTNFQNSFQDIVYYRILERQTL